MVGGGGTPARSGWWGVTLARSGWWQGGYPGQVWMVEGGLPQPGLDDGGGYPGQVWMVGGVTPQPGLDGGVPQPGLDGGGYPSQVWMVGVPGYPPPARSGWGTPHHDMVKKVTCEAN